MVYKYTVLGGVEPAWYAPAWQAHGFLFPVYVIATFRLGLSRRWKVGKMIVVMVAGTVPLMSFIAERRLAREEQGAV
jgi:integral membrane protein